MSSARLHGDPYVGWTDFEMSKVSIVIDRDRHYRVRLYVDHQKKEEVPVVQYKTGFKHLIHSSSSDGPKLIYVRPHPNIQRYAPPYAHRHSYESRDLSFLYTEYSVYTTNKPWMPRYDVRNINQIGRVSETS